MQTISTHLSVRGKGQSINQDSLCLTTFSLGGKKVTMAMVCDGIGSFPDSENASCFLTEWMLNRIYRGGLKTIRRLSGLPLMKSVSRDFFRCNMKFKETFNTPNGTTVVMLLMIDKRYYVFWSGDTRLYTGRRGKTKLLTRDDSESGSLTAGFTNLGYYPPNTASGRIKKGQSFLLCSDGFYRRMDEEMLRALLLPPPGKITEEERERLLRDCGDRITARNESDDISAVLIHVQ